MVSFELGEEEEKYVFLSYHKQGKKKILRPSDFALNCFTTSHRDYGGQGPLGRLYT